MQVLDAAVPTSAPAPDRQLLPYRTAFETRLDLREATELVSWQLRSWLRAKRLDVERFDARQTALGRDASLFYLSTNIASGWQLRERGGSGVTWVSTVAVTREADNQDASWVSLNVEAIGPAGAASTPAPPKLVRLLLDTLDAYDGEALLRSHPTVVKASQVEDLLDVVCAEGRRLPVVVAAPPAGIEFERWRRVVNDITRDLPGLASTYVLDPTAARDFDDGMGPTHRIGPGALRTYLPDVDPAVTEDAIRHRVLGWRRIESEPGRARWALAALPRRLAANAVPALAKRGLDLSLRDFTQEWTSAAPDGETDALQEENKLLTDLLATADDNERQLKESIGRLQDELLDLASELEVARDGLESRDDTIRSLRRRLITADRHADAYTPAEERTELPKSFADLLDRTGELAPFVVFTGDRSACLDLDYQPQSSIWSQTAWQGLLALRDYASAKQAGTFHGDFRRWCESPVGDGRVVPPGKLVPGESETVRGNRRLALMRTFPVPVEVDPAGEIFMGAHLKLGRSGSVSPRLYLHDASSGLGRIHVGYIGRHLANTLTS